MTNEEKFQKGIVIYKTENDVVCELWGASTKHADSFYSMNRDVEKGLFTKYEFADDPDYDISVEKDNKLLKITENGKVFKLDLIETRQKKR